MGGSGSAHFLGSERFRAALLVFFLAFGLRLAFVVLNGPSEALSRTGTWAIDAHDYDRLATGLLAGKGYVNGERPTAWRPPLYPIFLSAVYALAGPGSFFTARVLQAIMGALVCVLAAAWAGGLGGRRRGLIAGLGAACYPWLIFWSSELLTESLYGLLGFGALYCWWRYRGGATRWGLAAALLSGLTLLCRPVFASTAGLLWVAFVLGRRGRPLTNLLGIPLLVLLVLGPWTLRNWRVFGKPVLVSTNGGYNFYLGTFGRERLIEAFGSDIGEELESLTPLPSSEVEYDAQFKATVRAYALQNPGRYAGSCVRQFLRFWVVPGFEKYSSNGEQLLKAGVFLPVLLAGLAGLWALWRSGRREEAGFFLLLFLSASIPYAFAFGAYRFRIPLIDPALLVLASLKFQVSSFKFRAPRT